ncbi:glycoside hydrolase family 5 protein [Edaphobacter bradus]|uniref:glycoside hydrolase family 5 protein n=1 Tax=Edaphobacter bradus TaxID=2259016 RepID=UPI0021DFBB1A|nr:glycoside hydrolase family 5 protein [Edaphobacter bradus]
MLLRRMLRTIAAALIVLLAPLKLTAQFAHTQGSEIVDGSGKPLFLRGTSLGNWFVTEGYMWSFDGGPQSSREIEALVTELLGPDKAEEFWKQYRENYVTRADIHLLHEAGFNSIRIPMHYKYFESDDSEGFRLLDRVIRWSHEEGLYVILDMHAAPGGQTGANIDDGYGYPWLYDSPKEQAHLTAIWQRLARRYKDNQTVIGYDLLNEPIPHYPALRPLNPKLEPVYKKLTAAVRQVDSHHILFLGGAQWDTNFSVFGQPFDSNTAYTLHQYWMPVEQKAVQPYVDFRDKYKVPLWLGESGENTDEWIAQYVALLEKNDIGWAFWPYKKMEKTSAVVTVMPPEDWDKIVAFAKLPRGLGQVEDRLKARPDQATIDRAFAGFLENMKLEHSHANAGYLKALGLKPVSVSQ